MGKPLVYEITRGIVMQPEIINIAIKERTDFIDKKKNSIK